ncbi:hypothetical protein FHS18_006889 [Paenibacillus phyllosphaerae]|uniref:Uncharacterized protein n=1 Tax=Paenibacillus phyllosphaerae TaxID=274593 RepID=A0A7W5FRP0_9BACL|nr:hypothetical protein [Paenibacillus phyllosphaerae]MBB3114731.1 hypothetical protein [Paenibacillus phyllosphaerae]
MLKKNRKLIASFAFSVILLCPSVNQVSAATDNDLSKLKVNYATSLGHNGKTENQLIKEAIDSGLSNKEAIYFAKLDILANTIEKNNIIIDLNDRLPDDYFLSHPDEVRERALNLDKQAIASLFDTKTPSTEGFDKLVKQELKDLHGNGKVTVKYPDGSSFTANVSTVKTGEVDESYKTNDATQIEGPWNQSETITVGNPVSSSGQYTTTTEWTFTGNTYWAKVNDTYYYQVLNNGYTNSEYWSTKYVNDTGASSGGSGGFVTAQVENLSNHVYETGKNTTSGNEFIQGYTDVRFLLSASVSASVSFKWAGIGLSVAPGTWWHQYAITEVDYDGTPWHYAGTFK